MALVNLMKSGPFSFRVGVESKRMEWELMRELPNPAGRMSDLRADEHLMLRFHLLRMQAKDQAKAVVKNRHFPRTQLVPYLLFIGPYWTFEEFGPFSEAELTVRSGKPSDSGDFFKTVQAAIQAKAKPKKLKLFLLGTLESAYELE